MPEQHDGAVFAGRITQRHVEQVGLLQHAFIVREGVETLRSPALSFYADSKYAATRFDVCR